jgi:hypothetical protein
VTINVVAINGAQSFSPNPATLPAGQRIIWHNVDNTTHRVVLNDGSVDTGNLAPGASSQPMAIRAAGGAYHCAIHPEMVGSGTVKLTWTVRDDPSMSVSFYLSAGTRHFVPHQEGAGSQPTVVNGP